MANGISSLYIRLESDIPQMIIPGRSLIPRIIGSVRSAKIQAQPCGVDLTLKNIKSWTSAGSIDFDNNLRIQASSIMVPSGGHDHHPHGKQNPADPTAETTPRKIKMRLDRAEAVMLKSGSYLVDFNETVDVPLDSMGQMFVRSSLFRSGALLSAGVMDSGYKGAVGAMLQVVNPHGLLLYRDARLAQIVFHQMTEPVPGYSGMYQGSASV